VDRKNLPPKELNPAPYAIKLLPFSAKIKVFLKGVKNPIIPTNNLYKSMNSSLKGNLSCRAYH
jgi:hypothetical protein